MRGSELVIKLLLLAGWVFVAVMILISLFSGCSNYKTTTRTEAEALTIPERTASGESIKYVSLPVTNQLADSIGRSYLLKYCHGVDTIKNSGLSVVVKHSMRESYRLPMSGENTPSFMQNDKSQKMESYMSADMKADSQIVARRVDMYKSEQSPNDFQILWSAKFFLFFAVALGYSIRLIQKF